MPDSNPARSTTTTESTTPNPSGISEAEVLAHYVDMWKKTVDVQQHFNDIEWRIRGLALTAATFTLGAAGVAAKDNISVGWFSIGAVIVLIGLILWYGFYFVDRAWYHPLLRAAVAHGTKIEAEIQKSLPAAGMTAAITAGSRYTPSKTVQFFSRNNTMQSEDKLVWFYRVGAAALLIVAIFFQLATVFASPTPPNNDKITVQIVQQPAPTATAAPSGSRVTPHGGKATPDN